jgi:WD40 repeat protein
MLAGSGIAGLQPQPPWLFINTHDGLWAANMDGSNPVLLIPKSHPDSNIMLDLQTAISSPARQIAVATAERNGNHEVLSLQTISLPDGKLNRLTNLTTNAIELSPNGLPMSDIRNLGETAWSPDGKRLAFIGALDGPKTDVYVYEMDTGKIQRISKDELRDSSPTWSPDGKSILYYSENGLNAVAADGSSSKLLNISASLLGWRDNETAVINVHQSGSQAGQLNLYNIRTQEQTELDRGVLVDHAVVASGPKEDAGAILYDDPQDGLYLLPPGNTSPLKLEGEPTLSFYWDEQGRSFTILWEGSQSNLCTLMADGSHKQCAPFSRFSAETHVSTFGLIWGWTCATGENIGVWISGPGLETVHILDGLAGNPIWNIDNDLLFFRGSTLYRTTFNSHYTDAAPIASVTGEVYDVAWMGFADALAKKYAP